MDPCPPDGPAPVERTSQIPIYAIGDDGYHHKGVIWPGGGMRYNDNGNGTVTDNLTGLIWLKDAYCFGVQTWDWALLVSNSLSDGGCGLTDGSSIGDWRVPNVKELTSLIDYDFYDPALGYPCPNVQSFSYWTSTTLATFTDHAWYVQMVNGGVGTYNKSVYVNVWPVRGGHPY